MTDDMQTTSNDDSELTTEYTTPARSRYGVLREVGDTSCDGMSAAKKQFHGKIENEA